MQKKKKRFNLRVSFVFKEVEGSIIFENVIAFMEKDFKRENNAKFTTRRKIKNISFLFLYRIDKNYFLFIN